MFRFYEESAESNEVPSRYKEKKLQGVYFF